VIWHPKGKNEIAQCKKLMSTNIDMHVKKTVNSVLVTLDRCGKHELAATLLRKGSFVALIRSAEIEEYCQNLKDRGNWHSLQHGNYGILIDTRIPIPQHYNEFVELAQKISEEFAGIEEWYHT
jgi:hypothetical protein